MKTAGISASLSDPEQVATGITKLLQVEGLTRVTVLRHFIRHATASLCGIEEAARKLWGIMQECGSSKMHVIHSYSNLEDCWSMRRWTLIENFGSEHKS